MKKEEIKLSVFKDDMILYVENPKYITNRETQNLVINKFGKATTYKFITLKLVPFIYNKMNNLKKK